MQAEVLLGPGQRVARQTSIMLAGAEQTDPPAAQGHPSWQGSGPSLRSPISR